MKIHLTVLKKYFVRKIKNERENIPGVGEDVEFEKIKYFATIVKRIECDLFFLSN